MARAGRATPASLTGGTFSITNFGVFGVDGGTPIINPGESAILCLGAIRPQPWVVGDQVVPRQVMTLALSFDPEADDAESRLPNLAQGQRVDAAELTADGHTTNPPARYTEASLIKALEDLGIGRPSTYASIIRTITARDYVFKKGSALVPTWLAFAVTRLLEDHFPDLVDYAFTARMEEELDDVSGGPNGLRDAG